LAGSASFRHAMNQLPNIEAQLAAVNRFFEHQAQQFEHLRYEEELAA